MSPVQSDPMNDAAYYAFCMANPGLNIERAASGEIMIAPPGGLEASWRNLEAGGQLAKWARGDGRGKATGSSAQFLLPTGAALSPDAAWVSKAKLARLPKEELRKFPRLAPDFVVEVMSPSDRLKNAKAKMEAWMAAGEGPVAGFKLDLTEIWAGL